MIQHTGLSQTIRAFIAGLIGLTGGLGVYAQEVATDSEPILIDRYEQRLLLTSKFVAPYAENPALAAIRHTSSLSTIDVTYDSTNTEDYGLYQDGRGHTLTKVGANSFLRKRNMQMWGSAHYQSGVKKGLLFFSGSDLSETYPYFTADTVGGNVKSEVYAFAGGINRNTWQGGTAGISITYKALNEYRDIDPRPRNVTSDFRALLGLSQTLFGDYILAASGRYDVYKQRGYKVLTVNEIGGVEQLNMKGLAEMTKRFNSSDGSVYYKKHRKGVGLQLAPAHETGPYAKADYSTTTLERITTENTLFIPTNGSKEKRLQLSAGYLDNRKPETSWGVSNTYQYKHLTSYDYIVGDPKTGEYLVLDKHPMLYVQQWSDTLSISQQRKWRYQTTFQTNLSLYGSETHIANIYPEKKMHLSKIGLALNGVISKKWSKAVFALDAGADYQVDLDSSFEYNRTAYVEKIDRKKNPLMYLADYLDHTYAFLQSNMLHIHVCPTLGVEIGRSSGTPLAFTASAGYIYADNQVKYKSHTAFVKLGLAF